VIVKDPAIAVDGTTTTGYSTAIKHRGRAAASWQVDWTGSGLTATIKLYASNKAEPILTSDADWVEQTDVVIAGPTASASGQSMANVGNANFRWYRLKFTRSAGSGTFVVHAETNKQR
jgi:hypothetical protein